MFLTPLAYQANITFGQSNNQAPKPNCIASAHTTSKNEPSNKVPSPPPKGETPKPNCIAMALGRWG